MRDRQPNRRPTHAVVQPCAPGIPAGLAASLWIARAAHLELSRRMTVLQGFIAIVDNCVMQIRGNEAGVAYGHDPESVHQMRVGLRRLRSALGLFRDVISPPPSLQKEIDWLSGQLSAVRDWEVLARITLPSVESGGPQDTPLSALRNAAHGIAQARRKTLAKTVKSARFARLVKALTAWVANLGTPDCIELDASIRDFADRTLARGRKRLIQRGRHVREADPERRHRLRIATKKARYAMEFFQSLYPAKKVRQYAGRLLDLQDCLGQMNDIAVAERLLCELVETRPTLTESASYARGYLASSATRLDHRLCQLWQQAKSAEPPCAR